MMLKYILIAALLVTVASCCCFPNQFSSIIAASTFSGHGSTSSHTSAAGRLFYDVCNNRLRYDLYSHRTTFILDYKKGVSHTIINGTNCRTYSLRGNATKVCVPKTYSYLTSGSIGAGKHRLGFNVYGSRRTVGNNTYGYSWVTSARGCIPVTHGSYAKFPKGGLVSGTVWVNFTVGVADLSVFNKPPVCKSATRSLETMDFDIIDRIESDFSQQTKDGRQALDSMMSAYDKPKPNIPTFQEKPGEKQKEKFDEQKFLRENFGVGAFDL